MINIKLYNNFIKDLSGLDYYNNERVNGIIGFYVLGIDNSNEIDDLCHILYRGKADFINIDGRSNQLSTNLYIGNSESILQQSNFKKFSYLYEVLHNNENPTIVNINEKYKKNNPEIDDYNMIQFKNDSTIMDGSLVTMKQLKEKLNTEFRVAFDIYSSAYNEDSLLNNSDFLAGLTAYEGFRPVIDIHNLKVITNLISITLQENPLFHVHDLNSKNIQINGSSLNRPDYKNYSVNSLTEFVNPNIEPVLEQAQVCYEDWNLINILK